MGCNCILCGELLSNKVYSLKNMPAFVQNMYETKDNENDSIDLNLFECDKCGLFQFDCEPVYYYKDVIRAVGISDTLKNLRINQYKTLFDKYDLCGKKVWEVGCGGGEFLRLWDSLNVESYGVENNAELVSLANENGLKVSKGYVDSTYADQNGPFDAFTSFNYLEHQPNPSEWVKGIYENLSDGAVGLLTVPSFEYFIEKASYYEFMRDHIAYYTEDALKNLFLLNGFSVEDIGRFNGDTTYIIVKKNSSYNLKRESINYISCRDVTLPDFDLQRNNIENQINQFIKSNDISDIAVWGASHQGLTMLATLDFDFDISCIVDSSPIKWNKYSPVSHLKIISPDEFFQSNIKNVLIMAPAFSDEIYKYILSRSEYIEHVIAVKDDKMLILQ